MQPSYPLPPPSPLALNLSHHQGPWVPRIDWLESEGGFRELGRERVGSRQLPLEAHSERRAISKRSKDVSAVYRTEGFYSFVPIF